MDNQQNNTNGMNGNTIGSMENPTTNPNVGVNLNNTTVEVNHNTVFPNHGNGENDSLVNADSKPEIIKETVENTVPIDTVTPVKPTLDSILNGTVEPVATTVETLAPIAEQPKEIINPVETGEAVVDPSMSTNVNTNNTISTVPINSVEENAIASNETIAPIPQAIPTPTVVNDLTNTEIKIESIPEEPVNLVTPESTKVEETLVENTEPANSMNTEINSEPVIETIDTLAEEPIKEVVDSVPVEMNQTIAQPEALDTPEEPVNLATPESAKVEETPQQQPSIDDFNAVPVPPVFENNKKKKDRKGNSKLVIVILLLILIAAIGFGVYYFLALAKNKTTNTFTTKEVKLELGSILSYRVEDYVTLQGFKAEDCTLNLENVDINKVSTYKYTATCGKTTTEGTIIVDDTTKPEVITNDLTLLPNSTLNASDFIEQCIDASKCSYEFVGDVTNITKNIGEHEVEIIVSDEYNNQNTVKAKVTISRTAPAKYLTCVKKEETLEDISATFVDSYKIGVDANDNFFNATRKAEFKFNTLNDYTSIVNSYDNTVGIHNIIGQETFNENGKSIILKSNKTLEEMNKDLNGKLPNNINILRAFLSGLGYTCN